jgi:hypothetical protein
MQIRRGVRQQIKSSDGEFLYELQHGYELSPRLSEQILNSAKSHLVREHTLREGQIEVTVVGIEERSGRVLEKMEKKRVRLTIDNGVEDLGVVQEFGRIALRQVRLQRITDEAVEQGGVLSQEDVSKYLSCSLRTVKRDMEAIKQGGTDIITRGVLHNIGRGQTHKAKIVGLYLEGLTYSELKLRTRHSVGAIKRYLESFTKVAMAERRGIVQTREISGVTGLSEHLVRQYQALLRQSRSDAMRGENLGQLLERAGYRGEGGKTFKSTGKPVVPMIGGSR